MERRRMLVVSDDDDLQTTLQTALALLAGWEVVAADHRTAGHRLATERTLDGILLDVVILPAGVPSRAHLAWIGSVRRLPPVIVLTADAEACDRLAGQGLPVVGVLQKPVDITTLPRRIDALLNGGDRPARAPT